VPAGPLAPKCPKCGAHAFLLRSMATRPNGLSTPVRAPAVRCGTVTVPAKGKPTFRDKCGVVTLDRVPTPHRAAKKGSPKPRAAPKASKGGSTRPKRPARRATPSATPGKRSRAPSPRSTTRTRLTTAPLAPGVHGA